MTHELMSFKIIANLPEYKRYLSDSNSTHVHIVSAYLESRKKHQVLLLGLGPQRAAGESPAVAAGSPDEHLGTPGDPAGGGGALVAQLRHRHGLARPVSRSEVRSGQWLRLWGDDGPGQGQTRALDFEHVGKY